MLYAVDIGVEHVIDGVLTETMRGDPCSLIMGRGNGFLYGLRGERDSEVSNTAIDPVAHKFYPAISVTGFLSDRFH